MREIGGYFELERFYGKEYHTGYAFNTGRNALIWLLKSKGIDTLYLPYYLCDCIEIVCRKNKIKIKKYHIDREFLPIKLHLEKREYLYLVNYFGLISNEQIRQLKKQYKRIIVDNTQAFYQDAEEGIDTIYNCRKYFGVPDGAYLYTDLPMDDRLEMDLSSRRMEHLMGRLEENASKYYDSFQKNDKKFFEEPVKAMSELTHNLLRGIDYKKSYEIRERNFLYLQSRLKEIHQLERNIPKGPFAYPFYFKHGILLRKKLAEKKIYIPTLWPNVLEVSDEWLERDFTENILPLPCDQRYQITDMEYMVEQIKQFKSG